MSDLGVSPMEQIRAVKHYRRVMKKAFGMHLAFLERLAEVGLLVEQIRVKDGACGTGHVVAITAESYQDAHRTFTQDLKDVLVPLVYVSGPQTMDVRPRWQDTRGLAHNVNRTGNAFVTEDLAERYHGVLSWFMFQKPELPRVSMVGYCDIAARPEESNPDTRFHVVVKVAKHGVYTNSAGGERVQNWRPPEYFNGWEARNRVPHHENTLLRDSLFIRV